MGRNYNKEFNSSNCVVFFDFDNTITSCDVLDDMLARFSRDNRWLELEESWRKGQIGSRACLSGQLKGIRMTRKALDKYLLTIKLDRYFKRLLNLLEAKRIKTIVLSDNFDYILSRILKYNAVGNLRIYSNKLRFQRDRLIPQFPHRDSDCQSCAHCKRKNLLANVHKESIIFYIGDGHSDICPAKYADVVFAKRDLLRYFKKKKLPCLPFKNLKRIYNYFKKAPLKNSIQKTGTPIFYVK
ncbi:MAG: MtnX-like HAD-IB family phosphatase [Candidatus Omnitrophica bacterium]|nr:MtnX-like HAD-IB family phosphatase [Candidatus Omnitrophota bacterium]MDD5237955.1 MtnX-like HAD-IB family phosphatase [Candidatus Omnitrophota bacterium]